MDVTAKAGLGHHLVSYCTCTYHRQETHYEHNVSVGHRTLAATLCCSSQRHLDINCNKNRKNYHDQKTEANFLQMHGLSQNLFLHRTNTTYLLVRLGKYLPLLQESLHKLRR